MISHNMLFSLQIILVYLFKSEIKFRSHAVLLDLQGILCYQTLHNGKVVEYHFSSPAAEFRQELEKALIEAGFREYCFISSRITLQNSACVLSVEGMTCKSCSNQIETVIGQLPGVASIKVSLEFKEAFIEYDPAVIKAPQLTEKIYDMGFNAAVHS